MGQVSHRRVLIRIPGSNRIRGFRLKKSGNSTYCDEASLLLKCNWSLMSDPSESLTLPHRLCRTARYFDMSEFHVG